MKQCPKCSQVFGDETSFCLNDGAVLNNFVANSYSVPSGDDPTVFIPRVTALPSSSAPNTDAANSNKWLYPLLGILAGAVVVLGFLAFFQRPNSDRDNKSEKTSQIAENKPSVTQSPDNRQNIQKPEVNIPPTEISTKQIESQPVTTEAARSLLIRWQKAQDAQNFSAYQSCYGQPFLGVKRVGGSSKTYNYASWLSDRRKMLGTAIGLTVEIRNLQVSVDGDTATADFDQYYRSVRYSDWGPKTIRIKMFPDGPRIVYEELKASYKLN